ncbi:hypothetical protein PC116_g32687 [Phytophthora cactorum]|nr:hypothetical protein PC116_g32687 [Phytophthora cactorum]
MVPDVVVAPLVSDGLESWEAESASGYIGAEIKSGYRRILEVLQVTMTDLRGMVSAALVYLDLVSPR